MLSLWGLGKNEDMDDYDDDAFVEPDDDYMLHQVAGALEEEEEEEEFNNNNNNDKEQDNASSSLAMDTWTKAWTETCIQKGSLHTTAQEVLDHYCRNEEENKSLDRPHQSNVVTWNKNNKKAVVETFASAYRKHEQQQKEQQKEQQKQQSNEQGWVSAVTRRVSSLLYTSTSTAATSIMSPLKDDTYVYDSHYNWEEEDDDYQADVRKHIISWQESILHVPLAVQCCQTMIDMAANRVLLREGDDGSDTVLGWIATMQQQQQPQPQIHETLDPKSAPSMKLLLSKLPHEQINILLEVLQELNLVQVMDDLVIFGTRSDTTNSTDDNNDTQVRIALFRLDRAIRQAEQNIVTWTTQRDEALKKALQWKQKRKEKSSTNKSIQSSILQQLRRKKLYESNMERVHGVILNLEQIRNAVETAQSQSQLVAVLHESSLVLQGWNTHISIEQIDDLSLALQEEYQHLNQVQDTLQVSSQHAYYGSSDTGSGDGSYDNNEDDDDDALLKELEALTIEDESTTIATTTATTTTITTNEKDDVDVDTNAKQFVDQEKDEMHLPPLPPLPVVDDDKMKGQEHQETSSATPTNATEEQDQTVTKKKILIAA